MSDIVPCAYACEATDFERLALWRAEHVRMRWEQECEGRIVTVGKLAGKPVAVCLTWARLNGERGVFYEATSQVVDHEMVETWVRAHALTPRGVRCNAMNFHHITGEISESRGGRHA